MGWGGFVGNFVGGLGDVISDIGKSATGLLNEVGKAGQGIISGISDVGSMVDDAVHSTVNNIPEMFASLDDLGRLAVNGTVQPLSALASGDLNDWSKSVRNSFSTFDDIGTDLFGSGSWLTGGANFASTGNPFYGAGTTGAKLIEGNKYTSGSTTSAGGLMGMYDLGSNLANSGSTSGMTGSNTTTNYGNVDVATGSTYSPTYSDGGFLGGTTSTTPIPMDYSGVTSAPNMTLSGNEGNNMNYNTNYGNLDPTYTGTSADGLGAGTDYSGGLVNNNQVYLTGRAPSVFDQFGDLYQQFSNGVNSPLGQLGLSILGQRNPSLAGLTRLAGSGGQPDYTSQAIKGLTDIYAANEQRKTQKYLAEQQRLGSQQANDFINNQINSATALYAPGSAYSEQMRKQLERQDAQAGRRSQYGQREVELAAKLADKQAQVRQSALSQAPQFASNIKTATTGNQANALGLLDLYMKNKDAINSQIKPGMNYLRNLF